MAADIAKDINVEPELIGGGGGVFDVVVDGETIFSKHKESRFPDHQEILDALKKKA